MKEVVFSSGGIPFRPRHEAGRVGTRFLHPQDCDRGVWICAGQKYHSHHLHRLPAAGEVPPLCFCWSEKAFHCVPRKVLQWALGSLGGKEWAIRVIQGMYSNVWSHVQVNGQYSVELIMGVSMHQDSFLSLLLFILVLKVLLHNFCTGVPRELNYTNDLVIIANSLEECVVKLKAWMAGMESKILCTNMKKTKFLVSGHVLDISKDSRKFPRAVCGTGVGNSAIPCSW